MKNKAKLTISRPMYGDGRKVISIKVKDSDAVIQFLSIEIGLNEFAECLTGLSEVECEMETRELHNVGKIRETDSIEFEIPGPQYSIGEGDLNEIAKANTPEGWECSLYLKDGNVHYILAQRIHFLL